METIKSEKQFEEMTLIELQAEYFQAIMDKDLFRSTAIFEFVRTNYSK
jgi:hypothetical protein